MSTIEPIMVYICDTGATPKTPAAPVTKNISPTYTPEIQGWDFSWLEEGGI